MTDPTRDPEAWTPVLREVARASGHELRNALNALVVNLEVVRAGTVSLDDSLRTFVTQSVEQAEASVSVAEGTIALLNLVIGAIGSDGRVAATAQDGGVRIQASEGEADRLQKALYGLASRNAVRSEASGAAVILRGSGSTPDQRE